VPVVCGGQHNALAYAHGMSCAVAGSAQLPPLVNRRAKMVRSRRLACRVATEFEPGSVLQTAQMPARVVIVGWFQRDARRLGLCPVVLLLRTSSPRVRHASDRHNEAAGLVLSTNLWNALAIRRNGGVGRGRGSPLEMDGQGRVKSDMLLPAAATSFGRALGLFSGWALAS